MTRISKLIYIIVESIWHILLSAWWMVIHSIQGSAQFTVMGLLCGPCTNYYRYWKCCQMILSLLKLFWHNLRCLKASIHYTNVISGICICIQRKKKFAWASFLRWFECTFYSCLSIYKCLTCESMASPPHCRSPHQLLLLLFAATVLFNSAHDLLTYARDDLHCDNVYTWSPLPHMASACHFTYIVAINDSPQKIDNNHTAYEGR